MVLWLAAGSLVAGFLVLVAAFGLLDRSKQVLVIVRRSISVIRSAEMSDRAKETALQRDAVRLFRLFFFLAVGGAAAAGLPLVLVWLVARLGYFSFQSVMDVTLSTRFIVVSSVFATVLIWMLAKRGKPARESSYSSADRLLHRMAFKTYWVHIPIADIETVAFSGRLKTCSADRPVFVTALPRAGTTLLLDCCVTTPDAEFASHCYRDMPFVLTPCLWNTFTSFFMRQSALRERAHGDGMFINADSPEALEEVLWKTFWRRHYRKDRILLWKAEENAEFVKFFQDHMRKIILLRRNRSAASARYISKNNLNIARIRWIHETFPGSIIVAPFRKPLNHASSLLEQHRNFLTIHGEDPFASDYMRAIGHFDFGENLRPVDFDNWLDSRVSGNPLELTFWLEYWVACYRHLLNEHADAVRFFHYDNLCEHPEHGLRVLAGAVEAANPEALLSAAPNIRSGRPRRVDASAVPSSLLQKVDDLYSALKGAVWS